MEPRDHRYSAFLADAFRETGSFRRFLARGRPYICPFGLILDRIPAGGSLLDVGCGGGMMIALAFKEAHISEAYGFDPNSAAIAAARHTLGQLGMSATLAVSHNGREWADRKFDTVTMIDVMHHVPPTGHRAFLEGALDRVAPGGRLIYKDMCRNPLWRNAANRLHDLILARQWIHYAPIEDILSWSAEKGFRTLERRDASRLWYGHELAVLGR
jgi:2-polyprenyl-3-methyl-5-hydroxy-6-metoxy-1,4-benzoquinol methylase